MNFEKEVYAMKMKSKAKGSIYECVINLNPFHIVYEPRWKNFTPPLRWYTRLAYKKVKKYYNRNTREKSYQRLTRQDNKLKNNRFTFAEERLFCY